MKLREIEINNFRSIGSSPEGGAGLRLNDLQQVNIISAPNGVGKTSVIEALSVVFTGDVRRRGNSVPTASLLHARGLVQGDAWVRVEFDNSKDLRWESGYEKGGPSALALQDEVLHLLARGDYERDAVNSLFRLTHLLPQGWGERFSDQDGGARWAAVERALGLEGFRARIQKAQNAGPLRSLLRAREERQNLEVSSRKESHLELQRLKGEWEELSLKASSFGVLSHENFQEELETLSRELSLEACATSPAVLRKALGLLRGELESERKQSETVVEQVRVANFQKKVFELSLHDCEYERSEAVKKVERLTTALNYLQATRAKGEIEELRPKREHLTKAIHTLGLKSDYRDASRILEEFSSAQQLLASSGEKKSLEACVAVARTTLVDLGRRVKNVEEALNERKKSVSELLKLISGIRQHIDEHTESCPVCSHSFDPGHLVAQVERQASRLGDDGFVEKEEELRALRAEHRQRSDDLKALQASTAKIENDIRDGEAMRVQAEEGFRRLAVKYGVRVETADAATVELLRGVLASKLENVEYDANWSVVGLREELELVNHEILSLQRRIEAEPSIEDVELPFDTIEETKNERSLAVEKRDAAREAFRSAEGSLALAEEKLEQSLMTMKTLVPEAIKDANFDNLTVRIAEYYFSQEARFSTLEREVELLEKSERERAELAGLNNVEERLKMLMGTSGDVDSTAISADWIASCEAELWKKVNDAEAQSKETATAKAELAHVTKSLSDGMKQYENTCLEDLKPFVDEFLRALAPTFVWQSSLARHRKNAEQTISPLNRESGAGTFDPGSILSEGEYTGMGLAYLFAFHSRFQWSNWPALILDDPFQASDVVRAGALIDVLRNFSAERDTQIIMTTHDPQIADWTKRKMERRGLTTRHFQLARSADGVRVVSD